MTAVVETAIVALLARGLETAVEIRFDELRRQ